MTATISIMAPIAGTMSHIMYHSSFDGHLFRSSATTSKKFKENIIIVNSITTKIFSRSRVPVDERSAYVCVFSG